MNLHKHARLTPRGRALLVERVATSTVGRLSNAPGRQLTAITVRYAPGQASHAHRHPGAAFVYVLAGRVRSAVEGQPERIYRAGESWFEPPGTRHRLSANASTSRPVRSLVLFVAEPGAPLSVPDPPRQAPGVSR